MHRARFQGGERKNVSSRDHVWEAGGHRGWRPAGWAGWACPMFSASAHRWRQSTGDGAPRALQGSGSRQADRLRGCSRARSRRQGRCRACCGVQQRLPPIRVVKAKGEMKQSGREMGKGERARWREEEEGTRVARTGAGGLGEQSRRPERGHRGTRGRTRRAQRGGARTPPPPRGPIPTGAGGHSSLLLDLLLTYRKCV